MSPRHKRYAPKHGEDHHHESLHTEEGTSTQQRGEDQTTLETASQPPMVLLVIPRAKIPTTLTIVATVSSTRCPLILAHSLLRMGRLPLEFQMYSLWDGRTEVQGVTDLQDDMP